MWPDAKPAFDICLANRTLIHEIAVLLTKINTILCELQKDDIDSGARVISMLYSLWEILSPQEADSTIVAKIRAAMLTYLKKTPSNGRSRQQGMCPSSLFPKIL